MCKMGDLAQFMARFLENDQKMKTIGFCLVSRFETSQASWHKLPGQDPPFLKPAKTINPFLEYTNMSKHVNL